MIKTLAVAATVLLATAVCATTADAHTCTARSVQAMGYGISPRLATAKAIALTQCAVRTRRGLMCRVTACR
jgi:hypothetical protein